MDEKYNERAYEIMLSLAYYILSEQQFPVGLQFNLEGENHGKRIHVMMEVVEDDN